MPPETMRSAANDTSMPSSAPSKSQRKRDAHRSQDLGEALIELSPADRARLPLWPELEAAIDDAQGLVRIARRRQIRYIGRLLREGDWEAVAQALEEVRNPGRRERSRHLRLERLQDSLIESDEALFELHRRHPDIDMQQLRQLVLAARRERKSEKIEADADRPSSDRKGGDKHRKRLFRFLSQSGLEG